MPANTTEISMPGAHSDIGGAYVNGEQGKSNELGLYVLNYMYQQAQSVGSLLNPLPDNLKPSAETTAALNDYLMLRTKYEQVPTADAYNAMQSSLNLLKQNYIHDERMFGIIDNRITYPQQ